MNSTLALLAQNAPAPSQGSFLGMFAPLIIIFGIFYFLIIRPQQKQQKKLQQMVQNMRKGDAIITRGGIHGTLMSVTDHLATVEIANNVQIRVTRDAIVHVVAGNS